MKTTGKDNNVRRVANSSDNHPTQQKTSFDPLDPGSPYFNRRRIIAQKNRKTRAGIQLAMRLVKSGGRLSEEDMHQVHQAGLTETEIVTIMADAALHAPMTYIR